MARAADKTEDAVEDLNDELVRSTKITPKVTKATKKAVVETKKSAKAFQLQKNSMQQAGYQIQDFSVQMAGGTSFLTAFGQQAKPISRNFGTRRGSNRGCDCGQCCDWRCINEVSF